MKTALQTQGIALIDEFFGKRVRNPVDYKITFSGKCQQRLDASNEPSGLGEAAMPEGPTLRES